jgi:ketosteroid isomerase-like protein
MSRENAEIVRLIYKEWGKGDFGNREPFDEDLDFEMSGWVMIQSDPIKARGIDGMAGVWREVLRGWDDFRTGPIEELIEAGDQIVVFSRLVGRGRRSGVEVDARRGAVFTFREGKITRLFLADREEALEAAGLSD